MYDALAIAREPLLLEPLRRSIHEGAPPAYLRSLKLKLTARCNLKCVMCRYGRGWAPPELTTADWTRVLVEASELGCHKVHFSGGEVLVRPDFEQLVAVAAERRIKVTFDKLGIEIPNRGVPAPPPAPKTLPNVEFNRAKQVA